MASAEGLIGFAATNSEAILVPTYGRLAMLGTNPIACAVPADPVDFLFDASTSVVTRGKLEMYVKLGESLPEGWALDTEGQQTSDAPQVLRNILDKAGGGIAPLGGTEELLGGHKGYGFAMLCEIFTSILSLGGTSDTCMTKGFGNICHGFAAISPAAFGDPAAIKAHFSDFLAKLRESPKAKDAPRIYTHGEKEAESVADRMKNGIPVNDGTMRELYDLSVYLGMDFRAYFGSYVPAAAGVDSQQFIQQ